MKFFDKPIFLSIWNFILHHEHCSN